jgi:hypothetical protein
VSRRARNEWETPLASPLTRSQLARAIREGLNRGDFDEDPFEFFSLSETGRGRGCALTLAWLGRNAKVPIETLHRIYLGALGEITGDLAAHYVRANHSFFRRRLRIPARIVKIMDAYHMCGLSAAQIADRLEMDAKHPSAITWELGSHGEEDESL